MPKSDTAIIVTDAVEFDFSRMTAKHMTEFMAASKDSNFLRMSEIFAAVVTRCPPEWGAASDPETYYNLPVFGTFKELIQHLVTAAQDYSKN